MFTRDVLPVCSSHGTVALAYAQGSLVSGYTDAADLDVVLVWDEPIPTRRQWLALLHTRSDAAFFTHDALDLAIDRLWIGEQEFNLGHHSLERWLHHLRTNDGVALASDLTALQVRSGFVRGLVLHDPSGRAGEWHETARVVPDGLVEEARRRARNDWAYASGELAKAASRADHLVFTTVLGQTIVRQLVAVFAAAGWPYPGLKWVRQVMVGAGLEAEIIDRYDAVWTAPALEDIVAAAGRFAELAGADRL